MKGVIHVINKILEVLENYEKEYREREREFPCKYYAGRADAFHEIWEIIANMESNSNPYKQYEEIKRAISKRRYRLHSMNSLSRRYLISSGYERSRL